MKIVTHREMRNNSGELLRRVEAGESVQISNNGRLAAMIVPIDSASLEALADQGHARLARSPISSLGTIRRAPAIVPTRDIIRDARGRW
jgi:prevent-host-death family protein